ncbi:unnamed protein product [Alternaria alternata]
MNRQHAVAEPEQRDEHATEWAHRELNTMPIAVTQTDTPQAMLLIDGCDTLSSFPTSANPRDTSQSTSWVSFQPYQQRAGFAGCNHGQGSGLPEEVEQELAEAELRHAVARYEILEKAKAFSPSSHPRIVDAPCMDPVMGSTITDYGGESGPSNALMHSHQLFNHDPIPNDSGSMQVFNLGVWPTQQIPDTTFDLNPSQDGVHDPDQMSITFPNIHVDNSSAHYQAMYRGPFTETSMLLRTPPYNRMIPILDTGDQANNGSFLEATNPCHSTQSVLTPQGVRSVAVDADDLEINPIDDAAYNMTSPLTVTPWNGNIASHQGHPFVAVIERSQEAMISMIYELVERLRSFLDFTEPLHVRRFSSSFSFPPVLWSYSLSIIKWQKAIGSLWPSLKDDLYFHKEYHIHTMRPISLKSLDHMDYFGDYFSVALLLNIWYEELLAMDKNPIMRSSAKDHFQSALADRILHIYRSLFPTSTVGKASRTEGLDGQAIALSLFPSTTGLLPSHIRHLPMGDIALAILPHRKISICAYENLPAEKADPRCRKPPKHPFPMLKAYVPAQLFVILGLDIHMQVSSTDSQWMEPVELCIRKHLGNYDAGFQKEILDFSPYTVSIGTKALFNDVNRFPTEEGLGHQIRASWDGKGRTLLPRIIEFSIRYCTMLIRFVRLWSLLQKREVTLAEFVMENRDLEDKYFQVLVDDSESPRARLVPVVMSWVSTLGHSVDSEVVQSFLQFLHIREEAPGFGRTIGGLNTAGFLA